MSRLFHYKIVACLFFSFAISAISLAQFDERTFTRYSVRDGLSDNGIVCIEQDDLGYIWIGTDAGLNRFDGRSFKKYFQGTAPVYLASSSVSRLKRFGTDQLGIISRGGFQILNTRNFSRRDFIIPDSSAFSTYLNATWDASELMGGSYAVSTASGFYVYNAEGKIILRHDAYKITDIGNKRILYARDQFSLGQKKHLLYTDDDGLGIYDEQKNTFTVENTSHSDLTFFLHDGGPDTAYWVVKHKMSADEYIFIPYRKDKVIYYNHRLNKTVEGKLPSHMSDSLNWETRIVRLDDSTYIMNSRTNGFYLLHLDKKTGLISSTGEKFLSSYKILCMFVDKDKRLWAGTTEGLLKQQLQTPVFSSYRFQPAGGQKYTGGFTCSYRHKDRLYVGRFSLGKGLAVINAETMQLIKEVEFFGNSVQWNEIRTMEMYYKDTLWIGSNQGIIWYDTNTDTYGKLSDDPFYDWSKNLSAVLSPVKDDGYAWMCSMLGGKVVQYHVPTRTYKVFTSKTNPALPFDRVKHIVYDSYGDVWIAGHSLTRYNNKLGIFDTLITVYGGANKFNDDIVVIRADQNGSLWMHNVYNGLLEYRIKEKKFVSYGMKDGLPSEAVFGMSPVIKNKLWLSHSDQLSLFDIGTKHITVFNSDDGLPDQKPSGRRIQYDKPNGLLYLLSNEYIVSFPYLPERKKDPGNPLLIEEVRAGNNGSYYLPGDKIVLKHHENTINIDYSVIDFEKTNYQFAYRLDEEYGWNVIGNQRSITLNSLSPGKYKLQIRASGKPGVEKIKSFLIVVRPPFWKTTWFIGITVLLLAVAVTYLYRRRIRNIQQKANIDRMLSQTEMKALQAQMNPHFIFNSLNSIREMILNNENQDASHYLGKFAHLIRITLDQSSQSLVTLRNTIDYLQRYMEMETIRNSLFTHEIKVDDALDLDEVLVPPMLIQPFIENGLWHGVTAGNKKIHLIIDFKKEKDTLVCTINDNGIGIDQSQRSKTEGLNNRRSHGIANIKNRVNLLNEKYDLRARISIQDKKEITGGKETGTLVTLYLPLEINES